MSRRNRASATQLEALFRALFIDLFAVRNLGVLKLGSALLGLLMKATRAFHLVPGKALHRNPNGMDPLSTCHCDPTIPTVLQIIRRAH